MNTSIYAMSDSHDLLRIAQQDANHPEHGLVFRVEQGATGAAARFYWIPNW